ncbi:chemotaxis protein CheB [Lentzea aerocolonigenes]|uniref:chemotaxis protein CheB n=1 Tax=Lentzea aerocolonigenes TaxID=68170 RepID=UPI0004C2F46E|nr:chemotaxis protein CheB [Lentzea aerocolonigenes]MCP2247508.1 two-component system, chemotaxis family, response regulator CheB [Lentzea aerocolonigenes]
MIVGHAPDDSDQLTLALQQEGDIAVVSEATTADEAVRGVAVVLPDVVVLTLRAETRAWYDAIEHIMAFTPTPILVVANGIAGRRAPSAVRALMSGAIDVLPANGGWTSRFAAELRRAVRLVCGAHVVRHPRGLNPQRESLPRTRSPLVAVGASTGGPSALATFLGGLGDLDAPVLVVQHLHPEFTAGLVEWMGRVSALPVALAAHGETAQPGRVYFAPGGVHLRLTADRRLELTASPPATHQPSVDELFTSVAEQAGADAVGVLLTGIGDDGARGLLAMRGRGGQTFAQDESTSAVFGMPQAALRIGAVTRLLPIDQLAGAVRNATRKVAS